jgi:hypothetical protein
MAHCRRCGTEVFAGRTICSGCLGEFTTMRKIAMDFITSKYGELSQRNLEICQKEMRRLTNIWRRDPAKFESEVKR